MRRIMHLACLTAPAAAAALLLCLALGQGIAAPGAKAGDPGIVPPDSTAFGDKTLTEWMTIYWTWAYTGEPASGSIGRVLLMPLPASDQVGGSWTAADPAVLVGTKAISVKAGTPIVLPLVALVGEEYADGSKDPFPIVPDELFGDALSGQLFIDQDPQTDVPALTFAESLAFKAQAEFDQTLPYPEPTSYGAIGAAWFQTVGVVLKPLPVGTHTVHLDSQLILDPLVYGFDLGIVYHNTWTITVEP